MNNNNEEHAVSAIVRAAILIVSVFVASMLRAEPVTPRPDGGAGATPAATVSFMNRPVVELRATIAGATPASRAQRASEQLQRLDAEELERPIDRLDAVVNGEQVALFRLGDRLLFLLTRGDQPADDSRDFDAFQQQVESQLTVALHARRDTVLWPLLLRGVAFAAAATVLLVLLLRGIVRTRFAAQGRLQRAIERRLSGAVVAPFNWTQSLYQFSAHLVSGGAVLLALILFYLWLTFVLEQFPLTKPFGDRLGGFLLNLLWGIGQGFADAIPGVITVVVILLITRMIRDLVASIFDAIQQGRLAIPGIHRDTAGATRRLASVIVWVLGLTFAYPYIPGSQSDVFKGLSVLLGFMVTLGSAGIVNQLMSGMVLVYSRALRKGDLVRIGDVTGVVQEVNSLSVRLVNWREEVTLPNVLVVGNTIRNFSREVADERHALLVVTVTIGYDTPWRQVHEMLLASAARIDGLCAEPKPVVYQRALSDFYVEYELQVAIADPYQRIPVLSTLYAQIQDEFNAHGVQIMSPHYVMQPRQPVTVPREQWSGQLDQGANPP